MKVVVEISEVPSEDRGGYCLVGKDLNFMISPKSGTWNEKQAYSAAKALRFDVPDIDR